MTDEELILKSRNGDRLAQEEILNKYIGLVHAIAARFFLHGGENEDLVQEGMVGLYSAADGIVPQIVVGGKDSNRGNIPSMVEKDYPHCPGICHCERVFGGFGAGGNGRALLRRKRL